MSLLIDDIAFFIAQDPRREEWIIEKRQNDKDFSFLKPDGEGYDTFRNAIQYYVGMLRPNYPNPMR